jgi:hypothetical protein
LAEQRPLDVADVLSPGLGEAFGTESELVCFEQRFEIARLLQFRLACPVVAFLLLRSIRLATAAAATTATAAAGTLAKRFSCGAM